MRARLPITVLAGLGLGACATQQASSLAKVDDLVSWIERVHVDSELAREQARQAIMVLRDMTSPEFRGDVVMAYGEFVAAVERSEKQAASLQKSFDGMRSSAGPVFAKWEEDLMAFASESMRERSRDRLNATRGRYDEIVKEVEPTLVSLQEFNQGVRDSALFLGHDFNADALQMIAKEVQTLDTLAADLDGALGRCLQAARSYVESAALPMRVERQRLDAGSVSEMRARPPGN